MTAQEWIEGYFRAWEERDSEQAAALFTEQAIYRDQPYGEPYRGRDGVRTYWSTVTATQQDVRARVGTPAVSVDGRHGAVEWWVTMINGGAEITLAGILFLRFAADGLCEELREAWHFSEGRLEPPSGWGE